MGSAIKMIREDHRRLMGLFRQFHCAADDEAKRDVVNETLVELETHARLEEEFLFPLIRDFGDGRDLTGEPVEEHHMVRLLIMELAQMEPTDPHYDAKFAVLAETSCNHMYAEEEEVVPRAALAPPEKLAEAGRRMSEARPRLRKEAAHLVEASVREKVRAAFQQLERALGRDS